MVPNRGGGAGMDLNPLREDLRKAIAKALKKHKVEKGGFSYEVHFTDLDGIDETVTNCD